jgi:NTE family protein
MVGFVLSGGGNIGALQAGALQVLLREGIRPQLLVGTSVGSINSTFLATNPTLDGALQLGEIWKGIVKEDIYPGNPVRAAWHLATHLDSMFTRQHFIDFIQKHIPNGIHSFGQLGVELYIVATDLITGSRFLFGEDPTEHIVDAILASTAIPPIFPPWFYRGRVLVDGGISDNLPIRVAVQKGASEIYALDIIKPGPEDDGHWNVMEVVTQSIKDLVDQQRDRDLSMFSTYDGVTLHYMPLYAPRHFAFDDFSHASELIEHGRKLAEAYMKEQSTSRSLWIGNSDAGLTKIVTRARHFLTTIASHFNLSHSS